MNYIKIKSLDPEYIKFVLILPIGVVASERVLQSKGILHSVYIDNDYELCSENWTGSVENRRSTK